MRLLTRLSYVVVLIVLVLIASIVVPGMGFVLPRVATSPSSWLLHTTITYLLTVGVLFNYLAATLTSPGTVPECCADIPPAFRPRTVAGRSVGGAGSGSGCDSVDGGGGSDGDSGCSGHSDRRPYGSGSDGEQGSGGSDVGRTRGGAGDGMLQALAAGGGSNGARGRSAGSVAAGREDRGDVGGARPPKAAEAAALDGPAAAAAGASCAADGGANGSATRQPQQPQPATQQSAASASPAQPPEPVPQFSYSHLRYCWPCRGPQTHGSHHCYACGRCVVDQDHHCPFIANCVGRANLRNFVSFLAFTVIAMLYTSFMSAWLLIQDREDAAEALRTAAVMARRARTAATTAATAGGGGWLSRKLVPMTSRADALVTYGLTLIARSPLNLTVAAYILQMSLALLLAVGTLLAQTLRHVVRTGVGVDPAAAQRVARHHVHPASDAAAMIEAAEELGYGGWRDTLRCLRSVMCGGGGGGAGGGGGGAGSAWLWVWPLWGPPPGVLVAAPAAADEGNPRQRRHHPHTRITVGRSGGGNKKAKTH